MGLAAPAIGAVIGLGIAIDALARAMEEKLPPEGENWSDFKSIMIGRKLVPQVEGLIQKTQNPLQMLGVALLGPALSPHGEIQIAHDTWGWGGDWDDPPSPTYVQNIHQIANTGDPELIREFVRGIHIKTGKGGDTGNNYLLTDAYRRKFMSMIPESHPARQNMEGLFEPTPIEYTPNYLADQNSASFLAGTPIYGSREIGEGINRISEEIRWALVRLHLRFGKRVRN